ncbi:MAG: hypothetical protein ACBR15_13585 [Microcoleus sp.]
MNNSDVTGFDITPPSPPQGGKFRNQEEVTPPSPPQGGKFRNQEEVTSPSPPKGGNSGIRKKSPPPAPPRGEIQESGRREMQSNRWFQQLKIS